jgi:DNA-directed RNA polymerase subunit RPC12/RpoP
MMTAEWVCTKCGATNRRLVSTEATQVKDRCVTCHAKHVLARGPRPVRWQATVVNR